MLTFVLLQDRIISKDDVHLSPDDRGYLFGDGIYEVFRIYNSKLYETTAHIERLQRSAQGVKIALPFTSEQLLQRLEQLLQASGVTDGILYMQVTRGTAPRTHLIPQDIQPNLYAYCAPLERPLDAMRTGFSAVTAPDIRWHRCDLKTLNLLPNTLAKQDAIDRGADEVIMHRDGRITECSASNFMMVRDSAIYTHPANEWILHGITRQVVQRLARELGIEWREVTFTTADLIHADEAFITGTTVEITPIIMIDGQLVGGGQPGAITRRLQEAFEQTIG